MATYAAERVATCARRPAVSAGVPIVATKITAPGVPGWVVPRPRITKLIAQGTRWCPLTVVTGPAGAGKTTALALWAAAQPGTVAWVGLDQFDNRPGVFWANVVAALRRTGVALPPALPAAQRPDAGHVFLLWLAAALAAQDPPVTLVLDDLHLLTNHEVLDGLDYLLRNAGSGLRLVVAARMAPLPLHRYRLAGELTEIRSGDLAFTVAEAGLLLARYGSALPAGSVERLTRRTEGWAAGLRLAAISMSTHPGPDRFASELVTEDSALTGYLTEEVRGGWRRGRCGRGRRTSRLPGAAGAGGGVARPAVPRRGAGRPGGRAAGGRRAPAGRPSPRPGGACRPCLGAPGSP